MEEDVVLQNFEVDAANEWDDATNATPVADIEAATQIVLNNLGLPPRPDWDWIRPSAERE